MHEILPFLKIEANISPYRAEIENALPRVNTSRLNVPQLLTELYYGNTESCPLYHGGKCLDYVQYVEGTENTCFNCTKLNSKACGHDIKTWWLLMDKMRIDLIAQFPPEFNIRKELQVGLNWKKF